MIIAELLAKKIMGTYFINPGAILHLNSPVIRSTENLLIKISELPSEGDRDQDFAGRKRKNLEKALQLMVEKGWVTKVDWPDGYLSGRRRHRRRSGRGE